MALCQEEPRPHHLHEMPQTGMKTNPEPALVHFSFSPAPSVFVQQAGSEQTERGIVHMGSCQCVRSQSQAGPKVEKNCHWGAVRGFITKGNPGLG